MFKSNLNRQAEYHKPNLKGEKKEAREKGSDATPRNTNNKKIHKHTAPTTPPNHKEQSNINNTPNKQNYTFQEPQSCNNKHAQLPADWKPPSKKKQMGEKLGNYLREKTHIIEYLKK